MWHGSPGMRVSERRREEGIWEQKEEDWLSGKQRRFFYFIYPHLLETEEHTQNPV